MSAQTPPDRPDERQTARPARRRSRVIFDPRFAIGVVLIVASVIGVVSLVSGANASVEVLVARATLTPGQRVTAADLLVTSVRAGTPERLYLRAQSLPAGGLIVTRTIGQGELVPRSALGAVAGEDVTSVVLTLATAPPDSVQPGSRVDIWSARAIDSTSFDAPTVLVSAAVEVREVEQKGFVATTAGPSIELLVPRSDVAAILEASANGAAISVVPVDQPVDPSFGG